MTELAKIVATIFNIPETQVSEDLRRDKIPEWDSFNHLLLIAEVEMQLAINFSMQEVSSIHSYGDLKQLVESKL
jgi:acyl carrier protein